MIRCILLIFLISSCSVDLNHISEPPDLISRDKMVVILRDMSLLESHIQVKYTHVSGFQDCMLRSGEVVLKKYGVSSKQYESSMNFYCANQEEMKSIYSQVLDSLNRMSSSFKLDMNATSPVDQPAKSLFDKAKEISSTRK